jgi:hypothetical protein
MADILSVFAQAEQIAQELGIDTWQLQAGTYNGETFHVVRNIFDQLNHDLNPAAGIIDAATSLVGAFNNNITSDNATLYLNNNLPYGTSATSLGIVDSGRMKTIVMTPPNSPDVFQENGAYGNVITIQVLLWGPAYGKAYNNIFNKFLNPLLAGDQAYVLNHPVLGRIEDTHLLGYTTVHNPKAWRSCLCNFTFRTAKPVSQLTNSSPTVPVQLNTIITSLLTITGDLLNTWGTVSTIAKSFTQSGGNQLNNNQLLRQGQTSIQSTVNVNLTVAQLLVSNLKPPSYNNVRLNNVKTTSVTHIPAIFYFDSNMSPTDVNSIIQLNANAIDETIAILLQVNVSNIFDTINNLKAIQVNINNLGIALLNSFYGNTKTYTVPYDSDLFTICFNNKLDFASNASIIYQLNKNKIISTNYIKKNVQLLLPVSN